MKILRLACWLTIVAWMILQIASAAVCIHDINHRQYDVKRHRIVRVANAVNPFTYF